MLKTFFLTIMLSSQTWAKGYPMIDQVITDYFQGYQQADTTLIKNAFHPQTRLLSVDEGKLDVTEMQDWINSLEDRRARGDIRKGELQVASIDVTEKTASVKLNITFEKFSFTDYLSLLQVGGKWMIVGKIYHYQPKK